MYICIYVYMHIYIYTFVNAALITRDIYISVRICLCGVLVHLHLSLWHVSKANHIYEKRPVTETTERIQTYEGTRKYTCLRLTTHTLSLSLSLIYTYACTRIPLSRLYIRRYTYTHTPSLSLTNIYIRSYTHRYKPCLMSAAFMNVHKYIYIYVYISSFLSLSCVERDEHF